MTQTHKPQEEQCLGWRNGCRRQDYLPAGGGKRWARISCTFQRIKKIVFLIYICKSCFHCQQDDAKSGVKMKGGNRLLAWF